MNKKMEKPAIIRRNQVLKLMDAAEDPLNRKITFSLRFVKKDGELVYMPKAQTCGLKLNMKDNRMCGIIPVDDKGDPAGHPTPVHIDSFVEFNGLRVRM